MSDVIRRAVRKRYGSMSFMSPFSFFGHCDVCVVLIFGPSSFISQILSDAMKTWYCGEYSKSMTESYHISYIHIIMHHLWWR